MPPAARTGTASSADTGDTIQDRKERAIPERTQRLQVSLCLQLLSKRRPGARPGRRRLPAVPLAQGGGSLARLWCCALNVSSYQMTVLRGGRATGRPNPSSDGCLLPRSQDYGMLAPKH